MARWKLPESTVIPPILKLKWGREDILDGGYVAVPKRFLCCMREALGGKKPMSDLRVILAIVDFWQKDGKPPSLGALANISGLTREVVWERLTDLRNRRLITLKPARERESYYIEIRGLTDRIVELTKDEDDDLEEEPRKQGDENDDVMKKY